MQSNTLKGQDVWRPYDTFGLPVDLTLLIAEELGLGINQKEFDTAKAKSMEASKGGVKKGGKDVVKLPASWIEIDGVLQVSQVVMRIPQ